MEPTTETVAPEATEMATEVTEVEVESAVEPTTDVAQDDVAEQTTEVDDSQPRYTVKVDGAELEVGLDELLNGYSRTADYTRKTQELASERERLASLQRLEQHLNQDPAGTLKALQAAFGLDAEPDPELEAMDPIERKVHDMEQWRQQQEAQAREAEVVAEATTAASKHGLDIGADELLGFAVEKGIADLDIAAEYMAKVVKAAAPKPSTEQVVERKRAAAVVQGGHSRTPGSTAPPRPAKPSIREAWQMANRQS